MSFYGSAVGVAERLPSPIEKGSTRKPLVEQIEERRLSAGSAKGGAVGLGQALVDCLVVEQNACFRWQAQPRLDQPELQRLKARSRHQEVTEIQEVERRHGLEHIELGHK